MGNYSRRRGEKGGGGGIGHEGEQEKDKITDIHGWTTNKAQQGETAEVAPHTPFETWCPKPLRPSRILLVPRSRLRHRAPKEIWSWNCLAWQMRCTTWGRRSSTTRQRSVTSRVVENKWDYECAYAVDCCRITQAQIPSRNNVVQHLAAIDDMAQHISTMVPMQVLSDIDNARNPMQLTRERLERAATENQFMNGKIAAIEVSDCRAWVEGLY